RNQMAIECILAISKISDNFVSTHVIGIHLSRIVLWNAVDNRYDRTVGDGQGSLTVGIIVFVPLAVAIMSLLRVVRDYPVDRKSLIGIHVVPVRLIACRVVRGPSFAKWWP